MQIVIEEKKLFELVKKAVSEAIEESDFVIPTPDDIRAREKGLEELRCEDSINWKDYKRKRSEK
jgi:hypothetical protein